MAKKEQKIKFKKAPMAPRRFKSAYMFFSESQHKAIRSQTTNKKLRAAEVAKMVSTAWKTLSDAERSKYVEMGRLDRERYEREKKAYTGPWRVPDVKEPNAPFKKPMSSFLAFSNERRKAVAQANPDMNGTELSCLLAKLWRECPTEIKQQYRDRELCQRKEYKKCREEWERRQKLASKVAKWTNEMPNGHDLCTAFLEEDVNFDDSSSNCTGRVSSSEAFFHVPELPVTTDAIVSNPFLFGNSSDASLPFVWPETPSQVNQPNAAPVLSQFCEQVGTTNPTRSYDQYSMEDILQDDELFVDFSPRDVASVPCVPANDFCPGNISIV